MSDEQAVLDLVLGKLDRVSSQRGYWTALCPAHDDGNPSLDVKRGTDQPVILICRAGCATEDVLAAIGLTTGDICQPAQETAHVKGEWTPHGEATAVYTYTDEDGKTLYEVMRTPGKQFPVRVPDSTAKSGWRWRMGDTRRVLYRLPKLRGAIDGGKVIYVCYADDTEVLTPRGWVLMAKLPADARVAQYDSGEISFVTPVARQVFDYTGPMVALTADWSGLLVTPDHRVLCRWRGSGPVTIRAVDVGAQRWLPVAGNRAGSADGPTPDEARLLTAWQADGVNCPRGHRVAWNIRKDRKIIRLRRLLTALRIEWREQQFPSTPGWTYLSVDRRDAPVLDRLTGKRFGWDILDWPEASRRALLDELGYWDGDRPGREGVRYFTADEQCAEVVSAVAATTGWGSISRRDDRPGRPEQGPQWIVSLVPRDWRALGNAPVSEDYDGLVYCLTVPSSYLVTRRGGKVTISGNCEGEKDVHSVERAGGVGTCNPGGAGKWTPEFSEALRDATVIIVADADKPGRAHARMVAAALGGVAGSVEIREAAEGKDVTDHLATGRTLDDLMVTTEASLDAPAELALDLLAFVRQPDPPLRWVIPGLLEHGDRMIWTGAEGAGKTTVSRQVGVAASAGVQPFDPSRHYDPQTVLFIDCENRVRRSRRQFLRLVDVCDGRFRKIEDGRFRIVHRPEGINLVNPEEAAFVLERVTAYRPDLIIIGPLYKLHNTDVNDESAARAVVRVMEQAVSICDSALIVESHSPHGFPRSLRPRGSALFMAWPDYGFGIQPADPKNPDSEVARRRMEVKSWRGPRDDNDWPRDLTWGRETEFPWVVPPDLRARPSVIVPGPVPDRPARPAQPKYVRAPLPDFNPLEEDDAALWAEGPAVSKRRGEGD